MGKVGSSEFVDGGVLVAMQVDLPDQVAPVLRADVRQKSALGEPYVDLGPAQGPEDPGVVTARSAPLVPDEEHDGTRIPIERTSVPAELGQLLTDADALLADLDPQSLGDFIDGSAAIVGNEEDLRRILRSGATVAETIAGRHAELDALLANTAQLTETLDAASADVGGALDSFSQLGTVLAGRTQQLESILRDGSILGREGSKLLADTRPEVDGILSGLDTTVSTLADRPDKVREILTLTPLMIDRFGKTFEGGYFWLGASHVPFVPAIPRLGVPVTGKGLRIDRIFAPSIAQQVTLDLEALGASDFGLVQLLPQDQIGTAAKEPGGIDRLIDAARADLEDGTPQGG